MSLITIRRKNHFIRLVITRKEAPQTMPLGKILLRKKLITREQLDHALKLQLSTSQQLGEILLAQQLIKRLDLQRALVEQSWRKQGFWVIDNVPKARRLMRRRSHS